MNDTYGHSIGDEVLIKLSNTMSAHAEKTHMIARLGGDEFAVLLSESTMESATRIAEAIRTGLHIFINYRGVLLDIRFYYLHRRQYSKEWDRPSPFGV
ncbi:GGDEF domain-containing protein [Desulfosporosinus sp. Sb-LF]|uniref:GGDEF domain-containing protein n=1 Tax=Desulfosporosinus sp. Sb-LF TaxID=2560027 RepID=UPI00107FA4A9|nr:GGDEF domain-containing protein [Desulfosporosinus sp. Sb-LF]TGE33116.1 GGDEF domain-containing protein [Desulfosporosinus sp. Sb-LF]